MNKVILIYPEFPVSERQKFSVPVNLLHLGTYLEDKGIDVKLVDCNIEDEYKNILHERVKDVVAVGISCMTSQLPSAMGIVNFIRKDLASDVPIIFGGVHPTLYPEQITASPYINYAVVGNGEIPLEYLINTIAGLKQSEVQGGYAFNDKSRGFTYIPSKEEFDFTQLPNVNYLFLDKKVLDQFDTYSVGVLTSRGCPYRCAFCINTVRSENHKWMSWNARKMIDQVESLASLGARKIWFWDECFFISKKRTLEFIEEVERRKIDFEWFAGVRADYFGGHYLDTNLLRRLRNIGLRRVGIGAESGSQNILDFICKDISVKNLYNAAELCTKADIQPSFSFMIGLPTETESDINKTVRIMKKLSKLCPKATFLGPQLYRPYPGAKLYEICIRYGWSEPKDIDQWINFISYKLMETDPFSMPWIKNPYYVRIAWFYGIMWAIGYRKFARYFLQYCKIAQVNIGLRILGLWGITIIFFIGIIRRILHYYRIPFEIKLLKKYRAILSL